MRVLVCGDRNWTDRRSIEREIRKLLEVGLISLVIEGGARGADAIARNVADQLGIPRQTFLADWSAYGKAAGPIRNLRMIAEGKPDLVLAFHADLAKSKGTKDMIESATRAGIPVRHFDG
jgi:hypothetical protein